MTTTTEKLTAPDLLTAVRAARTARDAADVRLLVLAVQWAERHTPTPPPGTRSRSRSSKTSPVSTARIAEDHEWLGLPTLRWDTAASFAAALAMSTASGKAFIRDALVLAVRMPKVWARVLAGDVAAWRARRIAQAVLGEPDDVTTHVDTTIAPTAGQIGPVLLERALDEAMLRLHPEERELQQLADLDARYAHLDESTYNHSGIAEYIIRGDWSDLKAFDDTITTLAAALAQTGCEETGSEESLDVRRSIAVGILADPEAALALLHRPPAPQTPAKAKAKAKRRIILDLDLHPDHLAGLDPVILDKQGRATLEQIIRTWCARPDLNVWVRPIRHCGGCTHCPTDTKSGEKTDTYTPSTRDRETVTRRDRHCVFPHCTRPAAACDTDHIVPFDHTDPTRGGPTNPSNLAALCRHHHRLKTHAGWTYTMIEPGTYLWHDRYGQHFLRTRHGEVLSRNPRGHRPSLPVV